MNALDRLRQMLDEANIPYESYCRTHEDMKEQYGEYGKDKDGNPMVMTPEEAFEIISKLDRERKDNDTV